MQYDVAMVGLGTMGRNLVLNMMDKGFSVIGFDNNPKTAQLLLDEAKGNNNVAVAKDVHEMVAALKLPRKIILLVPAGKIVDDVLNNLSPLLSKDDIVVDSGNSYFKDTQRRVDYMLEKGLHFVGMGISGGEMGARLGPSIMPGGDEVAWQQLQPILEAVSAKIEGEACVAYMGKSAAGHYVKMVHNGIEYAIMQLISETYAVLKQAGLSNQELHETFKQWNEAELKSFLIEITAAVFLQKDEVTGNDLVDMILDKAGSKGTGKWTSQEAMDLPVSIPTIDIAVAMRTLSSLKDERVKMASIYKKETAEISLSKQKIIEQAKQALYAAIILSYAQGLEMLQRASVQLKMDIPLKDVVKIWRGGCIIRSTLLMDFYHAYQQEPLLPNVMLSQSIADKLKQSEDGLRKFINLSINQKIAVSAFTSALGYFDAYTSAKMPVNLIQAQRDYFGAHTYQRTDKEGTFHTQWEELGDGQ